MELEEGAKAPSFSLPDASGKIHRLEDYKGKTLVLYFYPKDDTPGCTVEACGFRDAERRIAEKGALVLGVSPDDAASHVKFAKKYSLPFTLLSDAAHQAAEKYGAWGKKKSMGREFEGIIRSTFVIGPDGKIRTAIYGVKPDGHAQEIMEKL
ncbi:MAG: thioredoxin-dependent thiol peroxidase [Candidatus Micrarchaeota archaeon]